MSGTDPCELSLHPSVELVLPQPQQDPLGHRAGLHPTAVSQGNCITSHTLVLQQGKSLPHPSGIPSSDTCGMAVLAAGDKNWPQHLPGTCLG